MERRDEKEAQETVLSGTDPKSDRAMTGEGRSIPTWRLSVIPGWAALEPLCGSAARPE